jgi:hypothetical protein
MHLERRVHFWIGDLLTYGERRWAEKYTEMIEHTGYDYATLRVLKWVASRVAISRRRESLSFAHHKEVAKLAPDQQALILARAEDKRWTREMVRHEVNRLAYEAERPAGPPILSGLHHGDCREVMAALADESIDLLLTDPPADGPEALRVLDDVLRCAGTKLKPNSHIYVFTTWEAYDEVSALVERDFDLCNALLWVTTDGARREVRAPADRQILFAHKGRRHLNGGRDADVLYFDPAPRHPLEKPVALLQYLIEKSTQLKEIVLDPFMGIGSICEAARNVGRRHLGIEADRHRYEQAVQRLAPALEA